MIDLSTRHASTQQIMKYFTYVHLPVELRYISESCCDLAETMVAALPDGDELIAGLRHLLEAKDSFVRAKLP